MVGSSAARTHAPSAATLPLRSDPDAAAVALFIGLPGNRNISRILRIFHFLEGLQARGKGTGATQPNAHGLTVVHKYRL